MNKKILFPLTLIPLVSTSLQAQKSVQTQRVDKRPNIILFMVDDMGWQDTSLPYVQHRTNYATRKATEPQFRGFLPHLCVFVV